MSNRFGGQQDNEPTGLNQHILVPSQPTEYWDEIESGSEDSLDWNGPSGASGGLSLKRGSGNGKDGGGKESGGKDGKDKG